jgi:CBS domain-containing protein
LASFFQPRQNFAGFLATQTLWKMAGNHFFIVYSNSLSIFCGAAHFLLGIKKTLFLGKIMPFERSIGQLMHPLKRYGVLSVEATVLTALEKMRHSVEGNGPAHLIVVSDAAAGNETIQGFVTPEDLVFGIASPFLKGAERAGAIFFEGLLEAEYRQAQEKTVAEIMSPVATSIEEDETLMQAIFLMNRHGVLLLPVTRNGEVTGVVHIEDVFRELLERISRQQRQTPPPGAGAKPPAMES